MADCSEVFVGLDTSKLRNAVAIAEGGRNGEVRYLGEIENAEAATRKLVKKLAASHRRLTFCYEAGPTGYGLYRQIKALGHECVVVAPSLIPKKPGDRVKTNRRDALNLAKLLRAGELTAVWVRVNGTRRCGIWCGHARLRSTTSNPNASRFCRCCCGSACIIRARTWTRTHMRWLVGQKLVHREQRIAAGDPRGGAGVVAFEGGDGTDGRARPRPHLGSDFMAEIGARQLMAYLGLVPGEESTGDRVWRGGITKAGNHRARRILVECSWSYRHPPRVGKKKLAKVEATLPAVQEIAWKAQARLTARYRALARRGKRPTLVVTAIARELSGFIWAVSQAVGAPATAAM
jgi:transposase